MNYFKETIFSNLYPKIVKEIRKRGKVVNTRNGKAKQILHAHVTFNPLYSVVGGRERNINIFFLMAEALWIWAGRKDVAFLKIFNSGIAEFSDDGENFHAPYGFRMRRWDVRSVGKELEKTKIANLDQVWNALELLNNNPETRRAVISIWNPRLDLNINSKDLPCNDMLFFSIQDSALHLMVANRSNDIHWGLPTNVFQFSFLGKVMSSILNIPFVVQTHAIANLHEYDSTARSIGDTLISSKISDLYTVEGIKPFELKFDESFYDEYEDIELRLQWLDITVNFIIDLIFRIYESDSYKVGYIPRLSDIITDDDRIQLSEIKATCYDLYVMARMLSIHAWYVKVRGNNSNNAARVVALEALTEFFLTEELANKNTNRVIKTDLMLMGLNFYENRLRKFKETINGNL